jgi:hypothetical protein
MCRKIRCDENFKIFWIFVQTKQSLIARSAGEGYAFILSHGKWGPSAAEFSIPHDSDSILPGADLRGLACQKGWVDGTMINAHCPLLLAVHGKWAARSACQWEQHKVTKRGPRGSVNVSMVRGARGVVLIRASDVARPVVVRRPPPPPLAVWFGPICHGILG